MRTRLVPFAMTAVLLGGGTAAVATAPAQAAPSGPDATIQSCYGSARNYTSAPGGSGSNAHWPGTGKYAYTTANCNDINLKVNYDRTVRTCFQKTGKCNDWKKARRGQWKLAATNVKTGTGFYIQFKGANRSTGQIAY